MRLRRYFSSDFGKGRAIELDAIRGVAILLAMGWHLNKPTGIFVLDAILAPSSAFGWVGVDIFFVLSGFLIGGLIIREIDTTRDFRVGRFLIRRAFRLWPVLYLFLLVQVVTGHNAFGEIVPQVFFHVQNYFHIPSKHLWSLAVEEQFYLLAALALPFVARRNWSSRRLAVVLIALALACTALRTGMWFAHESYVHLQWETQYRADALLTGILLALTKQRFEEFYTTLQRHRAIFVGIALACAIGLAWSGLELRSIVGVMFGTILGASLILAFDGMTLGKRDRFVLTPLAFLGLYSYSIYIWHVAVGVRIEGTVSGMTGSVALGVLASYGAVILVSVGITRAIERPMIDLRNRLFPSAQAASAAEATQDAGLGASRASA